VTLRARRLFLAHHRHASTPVPGHNTTIADSTDSNSPLISTHVPAEVKGRAFAAMGSFSSAATVLGTILGAPAVAAAGPAGALVFAGAGTFAATTLATPVLLRRKRGPEDTRHRSGGVDLERTAAPRA
jgi:hypothetical protein